MEELKFSAKKTAEQIVEDWEPLLAGNGYSNITPNNAPGEWSDGQKYLGSVAFLKETGNDGIVVNYYQDTSYQNEAKLTSITLIGDAREIINNSGTGNGFRKTKVAVNGDTFDGIEINSKNERYNSLIEHLGEVVYSKMH